MNQQSVRPARGGWREEETALLLSCVRQAEQEGRPLRQAFLQTAEALGRRPNSIRNYYYARLGEQLESARRKPAFELFSPAEVEELVRQVLLARGRGESVRACVTRLAGGDAKRMLRLQNKYRSVLKSRPELIARLTEELRLAGEPCPATAPPLHRLGQLAEDVELKCERLGEPLLPVLLSSLDRLLARAAMQPSAAAAEHAQERLMASRRECDRLKVERDLLKLALEDAHLMPPAGAVAGQCPAPISTEQNVVPTPSLDPDA